MFATSFLLNLHKMKEESHTMNDGLTFQVTSWEMWFLGAEVKSFNPVELALNGMS